MGASLLALAKSIYYRGLEELRRITRARRKISYLLPRLVSPRARRFSRMPAYFARSTISGENERLLLVV